MLTNPWFWVAIGAAIVAFIVAVAAPHWEQHNDHDLD